MTLDEARNAIGRRVTYTSHAEVPAHEQEHGEITSCNEQFAFVRYDGDHHGKATAPRLLTLDAAEVSR